MITPWESLTAAVYRDLVDGVAKEHIEKRHLTVDISEAWKSVFQWSLLNDSELKAVLYFSFNQFILPYLKREHEQAALACYQTSLLQNACASEKALNELPRFYRALFLEMNRSFKL